jgi:AcrR family transcriptional regulator
MEPMLEGAESGLRARKRRQTREQILDRAIDVFRRRGIRPAHLSEIARLSQVSQATLFNYFPNKGALAEAWVRGEIDLAVDQSSTDFAGRGLRAAMRIFCQRVAALASLGDDREVRLEAWRESGRANSRSMDTSQPLVQALRRWQESERVRGDVDALTMAEMLMEAIESGLIADLRRPLAGTDLAKGLRARVDLILDGARKRNQRVAAPRTADSTRGWIKRPVQSR